MLRESSGIRRTIRSDWMGFEPVTASFRCVRQLPSKSVKSIKPALTNRCWYARKLIIELTNTGSLTDPEVTNSDRIRDREKIFYLDPEEELFCWHFEPRNLQDPTRTTSHNSILGMVPLFRPRISPSGSSKQGYLSQGPFESQILCPSTSFGRRM